MTAGEIVVVVARSASRYRLIPPLWALAGGLLVPWPLIWLHPARPARIFLVQLASPRRLSLVFVDAARSDGPGAGLRQAARRAHEAAMREFIARGLTRTRQRTGVLIYVAAAEHYAEILADIGIADRVGRRSGGRSSRA